jgi:DNA-binding response OmpR family regulator
METKVTIASKNEELIDFLSFKFLSSGIACNVEEDSLSLFSTILNYCPDILIMDDNFQTNDQFYIAKFLLISPNLIIIYLLSESTENQRIRLLNEGVERIIIKPVSNAEVFANIETAINLIKHKVQNEHNLDQNCWILFRKGWKLLAPNKNSMELMIREYKFLTQLFLSPNEIVCKTKLVELVIGKNIYNSDYKLNKVIAELRKKVLVNLYLQLPVKTIHTVGYAFDSEAVIIE